MWIHVEISADNTVLQPTTMAPSVVSNDSSLNTRTWENLVTSL